MIEVKNLTKYYKGSLGAAVKTLLLLPCPERSLCFWGRMGQESLLPSKVL